jgi:hypothetical protein
MSEDQHKTHHSKPAKSPGTVFDVRRPGTGSISSNSRPIIVGHKPKVRDPVVVADRDEDRPLMDATKKVQVKPVHDEPAAPPTPPHSTAIAPPELANVAAQLTQAAPAPESPSPTPSPSPTASQQPAAAPEPSPEGTAPVKKEEPHLAHVETNTPPPLSEQVPGLREDTSYSVPGVQSQKHPPVSGATGTAHQTQAELEAAKAESEPFVVDPKSVVVYKNRGPLSVGKVLLWIVVVLAAVVIVGDLLLDAGVITTTRSVPHTHFIN